MNDEANTQLDAQRLLAESERRYRMLAENASDVVMFKGPDGLIKWVSPSVTAIVGWAPEDLIGRSGIEFTHPDDLPKEIAGGGIPVGRTMIRSRFRTADRGWRWFDSTLRTVTDESGTVLGVVGSSRDCQPEVDAIQALTESEERYRQLAENASDLVFRGNPKGILTWVSPSVTAALGWTPQEMVGRPVPTFLHPDDVETMRSASKGVNTGMPVAYEARFSTAGGSFLWLSVQARPFTDSTGSVAGRIASARVVQAEHEALELLARSERRFRLAMESAPGGMALVDLDRRFVEVNPALCRMLGRDQQWFLARGLSDVLTTADDALDVLLHAEALADGHSSATGEIALVCADGTSRWVQHSVGVLRGDDAAPRSFVSQFVDITGSRMAREELHFQATHDALTLLANRRELLTRADAILAAEPRTGTRLAVLFLDLDGFKPINDAHGHATGDRVLVAVATRIAAQVRGGDVVARVGGDEFVVLLPAVHTVTDAQRIAAKITRSVARPIDVGALEVQVTLSIGLALADPGDSTDDVLQHADHALYRAKRSGRARTVTFDPDVDLSLGA
ncbi:PAS domain S-box protein [Pengzhenrongella sp.]|uniref:sensor domain-containing protein n=1 Tax=Pengzhenrongella sp. TaxID=2888820 RepID=UPI002F9286B0